MIPVLLSLIAAARVFFQSRTDIAVEVLALRQQVAVLKRKRPRPPLRPLDRVFWTVLRTTWSRWPEALVIVKPETVVGWHRAGFRLYWRWKPRSHGGRPRITPEVRALIRRLAQENTDWGAPKIHGVLQKLGFVLSERTVARYLSRTQRRGDADKKWLAFLHNHREAIVAFDFFTVPTATFRILYCFFIIEHERRKILHFNVTRHPSEDWVVQQLLETFAEAAPYRLRHSRSPFHFQRRRHCLFGGHRTETKTNEHSSPMAKRDRRKMDWKLPPRDPRPYHPGERRTPRRVLREYVCYHQEDRVHDSLSKGTPGGRPIEPRPVDDASLTALPRLGGLHHRYTWRQAA